MSEKIYVWDPLVRIFHWTLVAAFIIAYLTGDEENIIHVYSGYYILALVAFRIVWGIIGSKYARFSSFSLSPAAVITYLSSLFSRDKGEDYTGHNPAGSWMVIIMLISLVITGVSGLKVYGLEGHGPLAQNTSSITTAYSPASSGHTTPRVIKISDDIYEEDDAHEYEQEDEAEEFWEEIHEFFANFTVFLVIAHIIGVILSSRKSGKNLVRAMINGYKEKT